MSFHLNQITKHNFQVATKWTAILVTFNAHEHSIANNNVLSLGHVTDIVKHPKVPDKDLFIFDTKNDRLIKTLSSLGTLLYGITVDSDDNVYISQTDARNHVNGRSGTKNIHLKNLKIAHS